MSKFHPVDVHVGLRLRQRRTLLGMSQTRLATFVGLTFQQVQKYESGSNRISASRLFEFAAVLGMPVSYFFSGLAGDVSSGKPKVVAPSNRAKTEGDTDLHSRRETLQFVRAYYKIGNMEQRRRIMRLVAALAKIDQTLRR